jgi:hypothetical protein
MQAFQIRTKISTWIWTFIYYPFSQGHENLSKIKFMHIIIGYLGFNFNGLGWRGNEEG